MLQKDYVAIALFTTALFVSILLWSFNLYGFSVPLLAMATMLGWGYFNYRNRWWKKTEIRDSA